MDASIVQDLLLNLFSEAVGIIVTVLIIDRILEHREKARWRPSKHIVYAKLTYLISSLLQDILPKPLWEFSEGIYMFGAARGVCTVNLKKPNLALDDIFLHLKPAIQNNIQLGVESVPKHRKQLDDFLSQSAFLFEPELLSLTLDLANAAQMYSPPISEENKQRIADYSSLALSSINYAAIKVLKWLMENSDRRTTFDSMVHEYRKFVS